MKASLPMPDSIAPFAQMLWKVVERWKTEGLPTRSGLLEEVDRLLNWKKKHRIDGLWHSPPLLVTATVDDGWGHGLEIIHQYAQIAGVRHHFLGLLKKPQSIIDACHRLRPDFLGLTVLQLDSEAVIRQISMHIPASTLLMAGGPVLAADADFARRAGIDHPAKHVADFIKFLLNWKPDADHHS